jgi:hypothetical protein
VAVLRRHNYRLPVVESQKKVRTCDGHIIVRR